MNELLLINKYIKPLVARNAGALGLADDVAIIKLSSANPLQIITTDCMLEKIHFFSHESPKSIAYRLIISNLSDMASKGGTPKYFTLTFCPSRISTLQDWWLTEFFNTIDELQKRYNIQLIGGNIAATSTNLMLSVTLIGESTKSEQELPFRYKAQLGDSIYVSAPIGDAYLGYCIIAAQQKMRPEPNWLIDLSTQEIDYLVNKYYYPVISLQLGEDLLEFASSCTDASDGIINSVYHICDASQFSAEISLTQALFSPVGQKVLQLSEEPVHNLLSTLINWGGDYNLVFTVPQHRILLFDYLIRDYASEDDLKITKLGSIVNLNHSYKQYVKILDLNNKVLEVDIFEHIHR